ncbi:MAG: type IV toxin-antitoxin system AbiEi family antitoxin domain-containing protein [Propionibacterium sp.]|nr:type IV toxin-antitoxin system AbiEi family antitoxin domain-containing protein [Propionibacterium sp.]
MSTTNPISTAELRGLGLSTSDIAALRTTGELTRLRRSMYARGLPDDESARHLALIAATLPLVHHSNVLSHTSAALWHDLPVRRDALDHVTMTRVTAGHSSRSAQLHVRNTRLTEDEIAVLDGTRVTSPARTVADLARTERPEWGVVAADAALRLGHSRDDVVDILDLHPRLNGRRKAKKVLAFADPLSESPAESVSRYNMALAGLPPPELQRELFDPDGEFIARVDFCWPEHGLVGEVDGKSKYGALLRPGQSADDVIMAEKRREGGIRGIGYWVVRWDWRVAVDPEALRRVVGQGLDRSTSLNARNLPRTGGFLSGGR